MSSEDDIRAAIALLERRLTNGSTVHVGDGQRYGYALLLRFPCWLIQFSGPTPGFVQARIYALEREGRLISSIAEAIRSETEQWKLAGLRTHNALRPLSRLPDEVLARVFMALHESGDSQSAERVIQVCHRWRRVASRQGSLWTDVTIIASRLSLEKAEAYLARASTSPIKITIDLSASRAVDHDFGRGLSERIIVPHAARCTAFSFTSSSHYTIDRLRLFPISTPTPTLRSLKIDVTKPHDQIPQVFNQRNVEAVTQSLRTLTVLGGHNQSTLDLLQQCSALISLNWCSTPSVPVNVPHNRDIHLPRLLVARTLGALPCSTLVSSVTAPNLQCLVWPVHDCGLRTPPGLFSGQPRFPSLKTIYLQSAHLLSPSQFSAFLAMHNALETLVLQDLAFNQSGGSILSQLEHARRPCAGLRQLCITFAEPGTLNRPIVWPPMAAPNTLPFSTRLVPTLLRILDSEPGQPQHSPLDSESLLHITIFDSVLNFHDFGELATHPRVKFMSSTAQCVAIYFWEALLSL